MTVVLATSSALPDLSQDDQLLYRALQASGVPVEIAVWDDSAVDWSQYELCVIRSTWDYVPKREQYVAWADHVASQTQLWNPAPLIRWNTDKAYLKTLEAQGVAIVPSVWLGRGSQVDIANLLQDKGWTDVVIKPVISAGGKDTFRVTPQNLAVQRDEIQTLLAGRDMMVQPFIASVKTTGELSLLFFEGEFSHAVAKVPAPQEFRVQEHLGGANQPVQTTPAQREFAVQILKELPWPALYARVDIMIGNRGELLLSEMELTEPSMYLAYDDKAAVRFAEAIQRKLSPVSV